MALPRKLSFKIYSKSLTGTLKIQETILFSYIVKKGGKSTSCDEEKGTNYTFQRKTQQDTKMESMSQKWQQFGAWATMRMRTLTNSEFREKLVAGEGR